MGEEGRPGSAKFTLKQEQEQEPGFPTPLVRVCGNRCVRCSHLFCAPNVISRGPLSGHINGVSKGRRNGESKMD